MSVCGVSYYCLDRGCDWCHGDQCLLFVLFIIDPWGTGSPQLLEEKPLGLFLNRDVELAGLEMPAGRGAPCWVLLARGFHQGRLPGAACRLLCEVTGLAVAGTALCSTAATGMPAAASVSLRLRAHKASVTEFTKAWQHKSMDWRKIIDGVNSSVSSKGLFLLSFIVLIFS